MRLFLWTEIIGTHPDALYSTIQVRGSRIVLSDPKPDDGFLVAQIIVRPEFLPEKALHLLNSTVATYTGAGVTTSTKPNTMTHQPSHPLALDPEVRS